MRIIRLTLVLFLHSSSSHAKVTFVQQQQQHSSQEAERLTYETFHQEQKYTPYSSSSSAHEGRGGAATVPNASHSSSSSSQRLYSSTTTSLVPIPECPLYYTSRWILILQWLKQVITKLGITLWKNHPYALGILPWFVGFFMGYCANKFTSFLLVGYKTHQWSTTQQSSNTRTTRTIQPKPEITRQSLLLTNTNTNSTTHRESGISPQFLPRHIAVIMDGNRRYGTTHYANPTKGHEAGSKTLLQFISWILDEEIPILTVYAFSTENWNRPPKEVSALLDLMERHLEELRKEALERGIAIHVLSTHLDPIPKTLRDKLTLLEDETQSGTQLQLNICLSYGSRGELTRACQTLCTQVQDGQITPQQITEQVLGNQLLTAGRGNDPDVLIRTSGEVRLSNFLLWQLAYAELFFWDKTWPEVEKEDLLEVIRAFGRDRKRRFGK